MKHTTDVVTRNCHECYAWSPIVYMETYFTSEGGVGIRYCYECAKQKTNELEDGVCVVVRKTNQL